MAEPDTYIDVAVDLLAEAVECLTDTPSGAPGSAFIAHGPNGVPQACCFAGDTRVITRSGTRAIRDLAGGVHWLMTAGGKWVAAPVRSFGVQQTQRITLERSQRRKVIRATSEHRWITGRGDVLTNQLVPGDMLGVETGECPSGTMPAPSGIARGIVYGDGHRLGRHTAMDLWDSRRWRVVSVDPPGRMEEVFCATVPGTRSFVLEDNILTGNCDYVSVQVTSVAPYSTFPSPQSLPSNCNSLEWGLAMTLRLRRCPYPHLSAVTGTPKLPDPAELTFASENLLRDIRRLQCCIVGAYYRGELFTNPHLPGLGEGLPVLWGTAVPYREADCAGWDWPITVGVYPCCGTPSASGS